MSDGYKNEFFSRTISNMGKNIKAKKTIDYMEGLKLIREQKCPVCGSIHLNYDDSSIDDRNYENVNCLDCRAYWTLHYDFNEQNYR